MEEDAGTARFRLAAYERIPQHHQIRTCNPHKIPTTSANETHEAGTSMEDHARQTLHRILRRHRLGNA